MKGLSADWPCIREGRTGEGGRGGLHAEPILKEVSVRSSALGSAAVHRSYPGHHFLLGVRTEVCMQVASDFLL